MQDHPEVKGSSSSNRQLGVGKCHLDSSSKICRGIHRGRSKEPHIYQFRTRHPATNANINTINSLMNQIPED
ncbi:hypothetical protein FOCC_FOCC009353 [Frankliniella occidentalis]|nr:hypothetical protein FOCC_FOCC009353 [Frankliniella occidentalis]